MRTTLVARVALLALVPTALAACGRDDDSGSGSDGTNDTDGTDEAAATGTADEADGDGEAGELSLLSYNVAGLPQEVSSENPEEHLPLISPLLNDYDLVLTQEDFDWWMPLLDDFDFVNYRDRLRADTTHEHTSDPHPGPEEVGLDPETRPDLQVGDGLGFLSRYPFTQVARVPWRDCFGGFDTSDGGAGDCLAMKGFALQRVELAEGIEVDVYNLHAEAGGTERDQELSEDNFEQLADFIEEHSEGRAVIVAGDTNLHARSDHPDGFDGADDVIWDEFLAHTDTVDVCFELDCEDPAQIDRASYRSGGGVSLTALTHDFPRERFSSPAGDDLSDHPPLVVTFRWSAS